MISIIGSTIFSFRLLDEHLHNALVNYNVYPNSFKHGGFQVNPQYTKLIFFSLFTFILLIQNLKIRKKKLKSNLTFIEILVLNFGKKPISMIL